MKYVDTYPIAMFWNTVSCIRTPSLNAYIDAETINFNHGANLSNCTRLRKLHFLSKSQNTLLNFHFFRISVKMQYIST